MLTESQQFYELISSRKKPLILFRSEASGDMIAAGLGLARIMRKLGAEPVLIGQGFELPVGYLFLSGHEEIRTTLTRNKKLEIKLDITNLGQPTMEHHIENNELRITITPEQGQINKEAVRLHDSSFEHDLIVVLNSPDLESLGSIYTENTDFFYEVPVINIDHCTENDHFGHLNIINLTATSVSEIIYDLINQLDRELLDEITATQLLTGMIHKTRSFQSESVTPRSLTAASELIALGADRDLIIRNLFQTKSVAALKLWGRVLQNLESNADQKLIWSKIESFDFEQTNTSPTDLPGVLEEMIVGIRDVAISVIFYEFNNAPKALIRSERGHDLLSLFVDQHPSGRKHQVSFSLTTSPDEIITKLQSLF